MQHRLWAWEPTGLRTRSTAENPLLLVKPQSNERGKYLQRKRDWWHQESDASLSAELWIWTKEMIIDPINIRKVQHTHQPICLVNWTVKFEDFYIFKTFLLARKKIN